MSGERSPGDEEQREHAFDTLWRDHAPAVLRYARRRVSPDDVEDVLAETFVVAWRRLDDVPALPLPWLLGVARRAAANTQRSRRRREALHERVAAQPAARATADPRDDVSPDASARTAAALAALRERDRELLTLIAWDGLEPEEAALALGCSRNALAVRLHRARRRFAAALAASTTGPTSTDRDQPRSGAHAPPRLVDLTCTVTQTDGGRP